MAWCITSHYEAGPPADPSRLFNLSSVAFLRGYTPEPSGGDLNIVDWATNLIYRYRKNVKIMRN
jgi:hypothetical protein